ncbi:hypothetical protein TKK_0007878 [Trichogramma kaykai]|uniref:Rad21/Rec8-like protein N-terminal domain-containing protein n=1 Tax=Trichogramma kaykai TaxID=54128 RepID=A0ABD2X854_9HYME
MFYPTTLLRRSKRGCLQKCRIAALSKTFMGQGAFKLKKVDIFKAEIEDCCDEIIVGVSELVGENSLWEASLSMFGLTRIFDKKMDFILADVKTLYGELTTLAKPSKSKKKEKSQKPTHLDVLTGVQEKSIDIDQPEINNDDMCVDFYQHFANDIPDTHQIRDDEYLDPIRPGIMDLDFINPFEDFSPRRRSYSSNFEDAPIPNQANETHQFELETEPPETNVSVNLPQTPNQSTEQFRAHSKRKSDKKHNETPSKKQRTGSFSSPSLQASKEHLRLSNLTESARSPLQPPPKFRISLFQMATDAPAIEQALPESSAQLSISSRLDEEHPIAHSPNRLGLSAFENDIREPHFDAGIEPMNTNGADAEFLNSQEFVKQAPFNGQSQYHIPESGAMMNAQEIYAPPSTSMLVESSQQAPASSENDSQSSTDNRRKRSKKGEEVCDNVKQIVLKNLGTSAFTRTIGHIDELAKKLQMLATNNLSNVPSHKRGTMLNENTYFSNKKLTNLFSKIVQGPIKRQSHSSGEPSIPRDNGTKKDEQLSRLAVNNIESRFSNENNFNERTIGVQQSNTYEQGFDNIEQAPQITEEANDNMELPPVPQILEELNDNLRKSNENVTSPENRQETDFNIYIDDVNYEYPQTVPVDENRSIPDSSSKTLEKSVNSCPDYFMNFGEFEKLLGIIFRAMGQKIAYRRELELNIDDILIPNETSTEELIIYLNFFIKFCEERRNFNIKQDKPYDPVFLVGLLK